MVNWNRYLESLCNAYAQWWRVYTITDVVGHHRVELEPSALLFDFGLMVQTVERGEERGKGEEKIERLGVLDGLRKYASEHVLLVGRPGSGKSTALARLLLEEAQKARSPLNPPLQRGEEDSNSLAPPLARGAGGVQPKTLALEEEDSDSLAPSLKRGAGGDLPKIPVLVELRYYRTSILDLIQAFLQRHDPNLTVDAETLKTWLRQGQLLLLVDGLNELPSEEARRDLHKLRQDYQKTTPMIFTTRDLGVGGDLDIAKKLEMQPLSEAQMQQFARAYLQKQGEQMLRQLGSRLREFGQTPLLLWMLCSLFKAMGKVPPNLGLVFRQFALSYDRKLKQDIPISRESRRWWHRLLEHLAWMMTKGETPTELQVAIPRQQPEAVLTEFLQGKVAHPEDCALSCLEDLLNHHLIQLGAGDQIEFRHQLIQEYYTAECLLKLLPSLSDDCLKRGYLNYLKWTEPLALMLELVEDEAQAVRVVKLALEVDLRLGARLAGAVKPEWQEQTVGLVAELEVPQQIKNRLLDITLSGSADCLHRFVFDLGNEISDSTLLEDGSETALVRALNNEDSRVRSLAAEALGQIGTEAAITALLQVLNDEDSGVRSNAAEALGRTGTEAAVPGLLQAFHDKDYEVRESATYALGELRSEAVIPTMLQALRHKDDEVRESAVYVLEQLGSEAAIPGLLRVMQDADSDVRWRAACVLGQLGNEAAIPVLLEVLNDENYEYSLVPWRAACVLVQLGNEAAIPVLLQALHDADYEDYYENPWFYEEAAKALGQLDADVAIPALHQALHDTNPKARETAIKALGQFDTEAAIPDLLQALDDEDFSVHRYAAVVLGKIGRPKLLPSLSELLIAKRETDLFNTIFAIQQRCKFYNYSLTQPISIIATRLMHILHLSDLHFGTPDQANLWSNQLAEDLQNDRNIPHLDALILSGDIANYSTQEEYKAAEQFLHNLRQDFPLNPDQIILVPGNHDLNWKVTNWEMADDVAYTLKLRRQCKPHELQDGYYIEESSNAVWVRDEAFYKQRFAHFSQFYETIKQKPYPLDYDQQYTLDHLKEQNLLILGLNSAWQLDHHYKTRASIHMGALTNALTQIRRNPDYKNCLKIAVWHHPLDSAGEDRITDQGFLEQLAVNGFRLFLHGHIHKAETSLYRYDMSTNGRKLDRICAGTFGTPVRDWVPGYPLKYNLLKFEDNQLTVITRRREELNGAWKPDARWLQGAGKEPLSYYEIELYPELPSSEAQPQQQPIQKVSSKSSVKRDQVFISYSHNDKKWLDKLQTMLKPMIRNNSISVWADTEIKPGSKWRDEIEKALAAANVAVLMVSQNFLASDFIVKHELPPLLNAAKREGLKIIWVPVSYCLYEETEIAEYQAAHNPSQPLESLKGANINKVLVKISKEIKAATESSTHA